jgi:hypothetical protein
VHLLPGGLNVFSGPHLLQAEQVPHAALVLVCGLSSYWTYYLCVVRHQQSVSSLVVPREATMWCWPRSDRSAHWFIARLFAATISGNWAHVEAFEALRIGGACRSSFRSSSSPVSLQPRRLVLLRQQLGDCSRETRPLVVSAGPMPSPVVPLGSASNSNCISPCC